MTRKIRSWEPGAIHHIAARGHCGDALFADDEERAFVVNRAVRAFEETDAVCLAWAVLPNHYHMLVRCQRPPGATFARLNTAIALRTLRRRGERGAVFQGRFFSDTCDDETSLLERLSYVLANPVHHRVVPTIAALSDHPWSAFAELLGLRQPVLTDVAAGLALLHPDPAVARRSLIQLLEIRARRWAGDDLYPSDDPFLGDAAEPPADPPLPSPRPAPAVAAPAPRVGKDSDWAARIAALVPVVCELTGADPDAVRSGSRARAASAVRSVVAHVACDIAGWPMSDAAGPLGVSAAALTTARLKGRTRITALGVSGRELLALSRT